MTGIYFSRVSFWNIDNSRITEFLLAFSLAIPKTKNFMTTCEKWPHIENLFFKPEVFEKIKSEISKIAVGKRFFFEIPDGALYDRKYLWIVEYMLYKTDNITINSTHTLFYYENFFENFLKIKNMSAEEIKTFFVNIGVSFYMTVSESETRRLENLGFEKIDSVRINALFDTYFKDYKNLSFFNKKINIFKINEVEIIESLKGSVFIKCYDKDKIIVESDGECEAVLKLAYDKNYKLKSDKTEVLTEKYPTSFGIDFYKIKFNYKGEHRLYFKKC
jgi:hypothetical protein